MLAAGDAAVTGRLGVLIVGVLALTPTAVSADSFTPVRMKITVAPVARLHKPLAITVSVSADSGVLDIREGAIRARVKLAATECGGEFKDTAGPVLLDRRLTPQPNPGKVYQGSASGSGRPTSYGVQRVCVYLEDQGVNRQFATDTTNFRVNVSRPCTSAAAKYDAAAGALAQAQAQLGHAQGTASRTRLTKLVVRRGANASADRRKARSACGAGVPL
jgi:hypothetical protein